MTVVETAPTLLPMSSGRLRAAYLTEMRYALVRLWRNPGLAIPTFLFPAMFYALVGFLFGAFNDEKPEVAMYLLGGFATMGAMSPGMFVLGIVFATEREQGLYQLRRAQPSPVSALLLGNAMMAFAATLIATALLLVLALALGVVSLSAVDVVAFSLVTAAGSVPFCALGLLLGAVLSAKAAPGIVNVVYLVLLYFSGLFIPLPEAISSIVLASPSFYLHQLLLETVGADNYLLGSVLNHLVVLVAVTVLCLGLAMRRLERTI